MSRSVRIALLVLTAALAGAHPAGAATTVVRGTFDYDLEDPSVGIVHFTCHEVRVQSDAGARETIHCVTTDRSLTSAFVFDPAHDFGGFPWFSDFTGEPSSDFHLVGTPTGLLDGWAVYDAV
jgi:hypothetical protein